ncbi:MAG TPA: M14 family zinc carboxypeptidase [Candidatus Limnocylindrales bacterium]|nr:M14 family zinc carboxypeptidase [Candidatus Limnocylindrales bacterium]
MPVAHRRTRGLALASAMAWLLGLAAGPAAAAPDFPARDARYHTYTEMVAEVHELADAHPELVQLFSIGKSAGGRDIWTAKVSDNVELDESEPEVLFDAVHHGDEHLTLEQALYLFATLVNDYDADEQVTALVDSREIWIVFMVNPDGAEYDLGGDPYRGWRKNRQPHPTSTSVGTDLNRNYDYRWGCCGGSSGNPGSSTYRGWRAFSAPEATALSRFVNSRVIAGRQQIRTHITLHANGELILWPYAYTRTNVPPDMTVADRDAFVRMASAMAARNGYTIRQSGDWYISDGDEIDWMYGRHRVFSFTLELYPPEGSSGLGGHHPPDEVIAGETERNRAALLYLIELADCPYRASRTQVANCGLLYDDFEINRGWKRDAFGEDTATGGAWGRGDPVATSSKGPKQLGTAVSGSRAFVTGLPAGKAPGSYDLDGRTSLASREITLPEDATTYGALTFSWYLAHSAASSSRDSFRVYVVNTATGTRTKVLEKLGRAVDLDAAWRVSSVSLSRFAGQTIRLLFVATDGSPGNLVEAGLDDVRIQRPG